MAEVDVELARRAWAHQRAVIQKKSRKGECDEKRFRIE
jgi:hypothetical protein